MKSNNLLSKYIYIVLFGLCLVQLNAQQTFPGTGVGDIPDGGSGCSNNGPALDVTFSVTGLTDPVMSVEVDMTLSHYWIGDVTATLIAPDGTSLVLFGRTGLSDDSDICGDSTELFATYLFTDNTSTEVEDNWWMVAAGLNSSEAQPGGSYRTTQIGPQFTTEFSFVTSLNNTFGGMEDANGNWILRFTDAGYEALGNVAEANLHIEAGGDCAIDIPDANFKNYLLGNPQINLNGNSQIECDEAQNFSGEIICPALGITNMTGLEAFENLTYLSCEANLLTYLDVSNNTKLERLFCEENQLTSLDVSQNTLLEGLVCFDNQITSLDLTQNTDLEVLNCRDNELTSLNIQNGNNTNIPDNYFIIHNNPELLCVQVDDADWSTQNWTTYVDSQTNFSEDCNLSVDDIDTLRNIVVYPNPVEVILTIKSDKKLIEEVQIYDVNGVVVYQNKPKKTETTLNISGLNTGIYIIKIISEGKSTTHKMIKK